MNKLKQNKFALPLIITAIVVLIVGGAIYYSRKNHNNDGKSAPTNTATQLTPVTSVTSVTPDQIFAKASTDLGFTRIQVKALTIYGQDRISYTLGQGVNFAYKLNGAWHAVSKTPYQGVPLCSEYAFVPDKYKPICFDRATNRTMYSMPIGGSGSASLNYPPAGALEYIKL